MKERIFSQAIAKYAIFLSMMISVVPADFVSAANTLEEFYPLRQGDTWTYITTTGGTVLRKH